MRKNIFFLPVSLPFFIFLLALPFLLLAVLALLEISPGPALEKALGLSVLEACGLYLACLAAGIVNLPLFAFKSRRDSEQKSVTYLGNKYQLPVWHGHNTSVSVNLGGCVLPLIAAVYLALPLQPLPALLSVAIVALGIFLASKPSHSAGYYVSALVPPLLSLAVALVALHLYGGGLYECARLAILAGTVGTIIGTGLPNLLRLRKMGTSFISLGGYGTFDGIILTGLLATVVACALAF